MVAWLLFAIPLGVFAMFGGFAVTMHRAVVAIVVVPRVGVLVGVSCAVLFR